VLLVLLVAGTVFLIDAMRAFVVRRRARAEVAARTGTIRDSERTVSEWGYRSTANQYRSSPDRFAPAAPVTSSMFRGSKEAFMVRLVVCLCVALLPVTAFAKPLPGSQHSPAVFVDEPVTWLQLVTRTGLGYGFKAAIGVQGVGSKSDQLRLDWKQKGKVLASAKCRFDVEDKYAAGDCDFDPSDGKKLTAKGAIDAELIFVDDKEGKEYLVRTFKVNVASWKDADSTQYQILADDVLTTAWIWHSNADERRSEQYHRPTLYLWFATVASLDNPTLRCTVDGKKLADDIEVSPGTSSTGKIVADYMPKGKPRQTITWEQSKLSPKLVWGKKDGNNTDAKAVWLADSPGKWDCELRSGGKAVRQLLFTVSDGKIVQNEIQSGKNSIPTVDGVSLIDVRIPKDAKFDERIQPTAMKKSMAFGLPWPGHASVKAIQASYPAQSGFADPK